MWSEIYKITNNVTKWLWSVTVTFIISLLTEELSTSGIKGLQLIQYNLSFFVGYFLIIISSISSILYYISKKIIFTETVTKKFVELMNNYTDERLKNIDLNGNFSWGKNMTIYCCEDMIFGWKSKDIRINNYDDVKYKFMPKGELLCETAYQQFINSEDFKKIIDYGNNLPRVMFTQYKANFDKTNKLLLLNFKRTDWGQVSYVWSKLRESNIAINNHINRFINGKESTIPNSFCMHLLIETADRKIVLSSISTAKSNDYPTTKAATIGEQLDINDIVGKDYRDNFIDGWLKRALGEEFGLIDDDYQKIIDEDSFRILSLDFEADIYNFTLFCVVRVKLTFSQFKNEIKKGLERKEISNVEAISIDDIPGILLQYPMNENEYHPSTYLRLLLYYIHKIGKKNAANNLIMDSKRKKRGILMSFLRSVYNLI